MSKKIATQQGFFEKLWFIYGQRLYKKMVSPKANFFLKPTDIISYRPTLFGTHEVHIEALIDHYGADYKDFLIDVGANIGLTSALVGHVFERIDCVEPNPLVANILKTNLALNLAPGCFEIHEIGLGKSAGKAVMKIPLTNFGGGYVEQDNPQFDASRQQDLSTDFSDRARFLEQSVPIKQALSWFSERFKEHQKSDRKKGVIKIDVEGFEEPIFEAILQSVPQNTHLLVIMENWFDHFPTDQFDTPHHTISWFYFQKQKRMLHSLPFKLLGLSSSYKTVLMPLDKHTPKPHDVICMITPHG